MHTMDELPKLSLTQNMLNKGIINANDLIQDYLKARNYIDYNDIELGGKIEKECTIIYESEKYNRQTI